MSVDKMKEYEDGIKALDRAIEHKIKRIVGAIVQDRYTGVDPIADTSLYIKANQLNLLLDQRKKLQKKIDKQRKVK
jgi:hypothetical protein